MLLADHHYQRLREEWDVFKQRVPFLLLCAFVMIYLSTILFRNIAFYRFVPRPRMKDLGYEILPDMEHNETFLKIKDVFLTGSMWLMGLASVLGVFSRRRNVKRAYAVNMLSRVIAVLAVGHTLRFFSYISTSFPGTAEKCLPGHLDEIKPPQPKSIHEVFTRVALNPGNNCGDLMFSGHMLGIITPVLMVKTYGYDCLVSTGWISHFAFQVLMVGCVVAIIGQGVIIICLRNHYTSDVFASCYVSPLLWHFFNKAIHPVDYEPRNMVKQDEPLLLREAGGGGVDFDEEEQH